MPGQRGNGRKTEEIENGHLAPQTLEQGDLQAGYLQRVTAQLEEVVRSSNLLQPEHLLPDLAEHALHVVLRRAVGGRRIASLESRFGQRAPVDLPAGRERKLIKEYHGDRHHVIREHALHIGEQSRFITRGISHKNIGHELLHPTPLVGHHGAFAHLGMPSQDGFHLAQLNAEAAYLDLLIAPAQELEKPAGLLPREIARPIEPLRRMPRQCQFDKSLLGQLGLVEVATGQAVAADE